MPSEHQIQAQCFQWHWNTCPDERGRLFMVYNSPKNRTHGAILRSIGMVAGVADMCYVGPGGKAVFFEVKKPGGCQSKAQKKFASIVQNSGAQYFIIKSLIEFQDVFTKLFTKGSDSR